MNDQSGANFCGNHSPGKSLDRVVYNMFKAFKYRLRPTKRQARILAEHLEERRLGRCGGRPRRTRMPCSGCTPRGRNCAMGSRCVRKRSGKCRGGVGRTRGENHGFSDTDAPAAIPRRRLLPSQRIDPSRSNRGRSPAYLGNSRSLTRLVGKAFPSARSKSLQSRWGQSAAGRHSAAGQPRGGVHADCRPCALGRGHGGPAGRASGALYRSDRGQARRNRRRAGGAAAIFTKIRSTGK